MRHRPSLLSSGLVIKPPSRWELTFAIAFGAYLASIIAIALFSSVEVRRIRKGGGGVMPQMAGVGV